MADLAYKGFHQIKSKLHIPSKKSKNISLPKIAKQINKEISRRRIAIEHINCQLKHFRILTERYRNRRKRFGLRAYPEYFLCKIKLKKAKLTNCRLVFRYLSQFFQSLLHFSNQANDLSTTQR